MKNLIIALSSIFLINFAATAQISVDGQIDISINIPVPEIVIVVDDPAPAPRPHPNPEIILQQGEELSFTFDSGDVLSMIIYTAQTNDFNYHFNSPGNAITNVKLNGYPIAIRDAGLSLQPKNQNFTAVINVHTINEGDFNGTVHF